MPKWQVSLTRDADAEVVVEAETAEEAKQIFLHDMDRNLIQWREGDWLGDTDIVEVLRFATTRNSRPSMRSIEADS
jgi:hypothetical protein